MKVTEESGDGIELVDRLVKKHDLTPHDDGDPRQRLAEMLGVSLKPDEKASVPKYHATRIAEIDALEIFYGDERVLSLCAEGLVRPAHHKTELLKTSLGLLWGVRPEAIAAGDTCIIHGGGIGMLEPQIQDYIGRGGLSLSRYGPTHTTHGSQNHLGLQQKEHYPMIPSSASPAVVEVDRVDKTIDATVTVIGQSPDLRIDGNFRRNVSVVADSTAYVPVSLYGKK